MRRNLSQVIWGGDKPGRAITLGIQHVFAMFGSTVLVPALTGLDASVTLLSMGIGTLIFHLVTRGIVPAFMGSSFSFITAICAVMTKCGGNAAYVGWGIMASGLLYLILAALVKVFGVKKITGFFPPVVTGCMIIIIGMMLAPTAMSNITGVPGTYGFYDPIEIVESAEQKDGFVRFENGTVKGWISMDDLEQTEDGSWRVANENGTQLLDEATADAKPLTATLRWKYWVVGIFTILVIVLVMFFVRGFFKLIPILIGIVAGYLLSIALGLVDFSALEAAPWFTLPKTSFFLQKDLDWSGVGYAVTMIAPIAVVTFVEHVGDITANGAVTGHNYLEDPGLHRTLLGCGLASVFSGGLGGPAATTYSENTGVLAATRNYNPATLRIAALFAIALAFVGKVSGLLKSIPAPVMGGVSVILFGMIASVGLRMLVESKVDFTRSYNLIIAGVMLVFGLGLSSGITVGSVTISGTAIAAVLGILLSRILPKKDADERQEEKLAAQNRRQ